MTHAIWAYPWDHHDIGLDEALGEIAAAGIDGVSLAISYHAGRFLQPGNPRRRVYFPEDSTVYYRPDPARWSDAEIAARATCIATEQGDMLRALVDRREAGGPRSIAGRSACTTTASEPRLADLLRRPLPRMRRGRRRERRARATSRPGRGSRTEAEKADRN